ncbi:aminodeoxyfutalosine synthase [Seinonella peptonophila]|uniref:Aminodeoxyfutalosine synthase n=1 Tax=Seinonella peptonophila TaxID=112248 RepID=A0A1M4WKA4_9BACL|nr:aminofutalosine synthase MqnE [Seinonella peptonophila]SHE81412.1 aminodeoxyfutalosine synthase [Seinonella peptonophila]
MIDPQLKPIAAKIERNERLTLEDGLTLYRSEDLLTIASWANQANLKQNGKNVYFIQNMALYPTNVCEAKCSFCGFRRDPDSEGAYTKTPEELIAYIDERITERTQEFHIVGGHNHTVPYAYYIQTIAALKKRYPHVVIKAYTAAEIQFFAKIANRSIEDVLADLIEAGLDTLPGGGAEILSERYREKMSPDKASTDEWLAVHRAAHKMGLKTHATMLYGSIETLEERLIHMIRLRELQDETNGFMVFIPLAIQPRNVNASIRRRTSAMDDLRTIAISRLMLDNFQHIKAYWINIGTQLTQLALQFGASDIHGTIVEEQISHSAGALTQTALTREDLVWLIEGANRIPIERDTFYNPIKIYKKETTAT